MVEPLVVIVMLLRFVDLGNALLLICGTSSLITSCLLAIIGKKRFALITTVVAVVSFKVERRMTKKARRYSCLE